MYFQQPQKLNVFPYIFALVSGLVVSSIFSILLTTQNYYKECSSAVVQALTGTSCDSILLAHNVFIVVLILGIAVFLSGLVGLLYAVIREK